MSGEVCDRRIAIGLKMKDNRHTSSVAWGDLGSELDKIHRKEQRCEC